MTDFDDFLSIKALKCLILKGLERLVKRCKSKEGVGSGSAACCLSKKHTCSRRNLFFFGLDVSNMTEILEGFLLFCLRAEAVPRPGLDAIFVHCHYNSRGFMFFFVFGNFW